MNARGGGRWRGFDPETGEWTVELEPYPVPLIVGRTLERGVARRRVVELEGVGRDGVVNDPGYLVYPVSRVVG